MLDFGGLDQSNSHFPLIHRLTPGLGVLDSKSSLQITISKGNRWPAFLDTFCHRTLCGAVGACGTDDLAVRRLDRPGRRRRKWILYLRLATRPTYYPLTAPLFAVPEISP